MSALTLTGNFVSMSLNGSPPTTLIFSSVDSISGKATEGASRLDNGAVIGMRTRIASTDPLYVQLQAAFNAGTSEDFTIDEGDGSMSTFTGLIESWDTSIAGQVSFRLRITSSITRG